MRDSNGTLENLYVRVCTPLSRFEPRDWSTLIPSGRSLARAVQRQGSRRQTVNRTTGPQEYRRCRRFSWVLYKSYQAPGRLGRGDSRSCASQETGTSTTLPGLRGRLDLSLVISLAKYLSSQTQFCWTIQLSLRSIHWHLRVSSRVSLSANYFDGPLNLIYRLWDQAIDGCI